MSKLKPVAIVAGVITISNLLFKNSLPLGHYFTAEGFGELMGQFAFAFLPAYVAVRLLIRFWLKGDPTNAAPAAADTL